MPLVERLKAIVARNKGPRRNFGYRGFGDCSSLIFRAWRSRFWWARLTGWGTKLKLAFAFNCHDTVGIDLVAMSVNDILVQGQARCFSLDYFACNGKLDVDVAATVVEGVAMGLPQGRLRAAWRRDGRDAGYVRARRTRPGGLLRGALSIMPA